MLGKMERSPGLSSVTVILCFQSPTPITFSWTPSLDSPHDSPHYSPCDSPITSPITLDFPSAPAAALLILNAGTPQAFLWPCDPRTIHLWLWQPLVCSWSQVHVSLPSFSSCLRGMYLMAMGYLYTGDHGQVQHTTSKWTLPFPSHPKCYLFC
jgi:hypothetical protein